jgi:hypothetical protein
MRPCGSILSIYSSERRHMSHINHFGANMRNALLFNQVHESENRKSTQFFYTMALLRKRRCQPESYEFTRAPTLLSTSSKHGTPCYPQRNAGFLDYSACARLDRLVDHIWRELHWLQSNSRALGTRSRYHHLASLEHRHRPSVQQVSQWLRYYLLDECDQLPALWRTHRSWRHN